MRPREILSPEDNEESVTSVGKGCSEKIKRKKGFQSHPILSVIQTNGLRSVVFMKSLDSLFSHSVSFLSLYFKVKEYC